MNSKNILVSKDGTAITIIDFANIKKDLVYKDIAKLEVDLAIFGINPDVWSSFDWQNSTDWEKLLPIYGISSITHKKPVPAQDVPEIDKSLEVIYSLREILWSQDEYNPKLYTLSLLHALLCNVTYQDVSIPKKIFGLKCAVAVFETFFKF